MGTKHPDFVSAQGCFVRPGTEWPVFVSAQGFVARTGTKYPGFVTGVNQSISMNFSMPLVATSWMKVTRGSLMGTGLGSMT